MYISIYIYISVLPIFICIVTFIMSLLSLKTVQYFQMFWYYSDNHLFKQKLHSLKTSARSHFGLFWGSFRWYSSIESCLTLSHNGLYKYFLHYTPMLTALKRKITACRPLLEAILGYFLVWFVVFSIS